MHSPARRHLIAAFLAFAALGLVGPAIAQIESLQTYDKAPLEIRTASGTHRFTVELARTAAQQMQGLMFRRKLDANAGMLFIYQQPETARYWMKNTYIPLDMLFIASDGTVVRIAADAVPQSLAIISSGGPVRAVLEIKGGEAARQGITPGAKVVYPLFSPNH